MKRIDVAHSGTLRRDLPAFRAGDTVRVHVKIKETVLSVETTLKKTKNRREGNSPKPNF